VLASFNLFASSKALLASAKAPFFPAASIKEL
jgi:hypothetical protein